MVAPPNYLRFSKFPPESLLFLGLLLLPISSPAAIRVSPEFDRYAVVAGSELTLNVVIDADDTQPGLQPVAGGLFSAGVRARFPASMPPITPAGVPPTLDFSGFSPGAARGAAATQASIKGNVDPRPFPLEYHASTSLASFKLSPPPTASGTFTVRFELPRDSPNETIFIDASGNDLDPAISFGSATVSIIAPLQIARSPAGVALTYGTAPSFDHHLEFRPSLTSPWQPLPGNPRNSGSASEPITARLRFYRVVLARRL